MSRITEELIRRRAEHHDGILADLEELSLHQCELERLEVVGHLCRKLRILYLQNNVIPKIENVTHLKELRYLNLALNNVTKVEGLASCEFLNKLDLTVNFVDVDALEESAAHLSGLLHLRELFLMGNPCMEWEGARLYIIAVVPQLVALDGKEITRAERIAAAQGLKRLREELRLLAAAKRESKGVASATGGGSTDAGCEDDSEGEEVAGGAGHGGSGGGGEEGEGAWTPAARLKMYREMAAAKAEKEARQRGMEPRKRDAEAEHAAAVARMKEREAAGSIRQCNEGRWQFTYTDDDGHGNVVLRVQLSKFLDTSLIHIDVHPTWITLVIKHRTFRLALMDEVKSDAATCQRSQTTGELVVTMPRVHGRAKHRLHATDATPSPAPTLAPRTVPATTTGGAATDTGASDRVRLLHPSTRPTKLGDELLLAVASMGGRGELPTGKPPPCTAAALPGTPGPTAAAPSSRAAAVDGDVLDSEVPPLE